MSFIRGSTHSSSRRPAPGKSDAINQIGPRTCENTTRPRRATPPPADENGPGAVEAKAARCIDRALSGPLASSRALYTSGLAAVNDYTQSSKGALFARLAADVQDAILSDIERNIATGFTPSSAAFFDVVRTHTIEGTFSDPYYGGNANFVGWDLIGYPGVRTGVTEGQQRMGVKIAPNHRSAYDFSLFSKPAG